MEPNTQISLAMEYGIRILSSWEDDNKEIGMVEVRERIQKALGEMCDEERIIMRTYLTEYKIFLREILNNFGFLGFEMIKTKEKGEETESYKHVKDEFAPNQRFFRRSFGGDKSRLFDSIEIINVAIEVADVALFEVEKSLPFEDKVLGKKNEDINV